MKNTQQAPLISVCIPTYNGARYITECLNSVAKQNYLNFEVVISDDQSTDNTIQICEAFQKSAPFPVSIYHHTPSGIAQNWNHCTQHAKGDFVKFLFQDDVLHQNCLDELAAKIDPNQTHQFIFCNRNFIVEDELANDLVTLAWMERYKDLAKRWKLDLTKGMDGKELIRKSSNLFAYPLNKIGEPSITLISRSVFEMQKFDSALNQMTDVEFYYRIFSNCHITYVDKSLVSIRLHSNQVTSQNLENNKADEDLLLYQKLHQVAHLHPFAHLFPYKYKAKKAIKRFLGMK